MLCRFMFFITRCSILSYGSWKKIYDLVTTFKNFRQASWICIISSRVLVLQCTIYSVQCTVCSVHTYTICKINQSLVDWRRLLCWFSLKNSKLLNVSRRFYADILHYANTRSVFYFPCHSQNKTLTHLTHLWKCVEYIL